MLESSRAGKRVAADYHRLGVVYQLDVVFPSKSRSWHLDFGGPVAFTSGPSPHRHIHARIAASMLVDSVRGESTVAFVYAAGGYRCSHRVHAVEPHGMYTWTPASEQAVVDPLWMALDLDDLFEKNINREIATHHSTAREST